MERNKIIHNLRQLLASVQQMRGRLINLSPIGFQLGQFNLFRRLPGLHGFAERRGREQLPGSIELRGGEILIARHKGSLGQPLASKCFSQSLFGQSDCAGCFFFQGERKIPFTLFVRGKSQV